MLRRHLQLGRVRTGYPLEGKQGGGKDLPDNLFQLKEEVPGSDAIEDKVFAQDGGENT